MAHFYRLCAPRLVFVMQVVNLKKDNKKLMAELASMASEAKAASQERDDLLATQTVGVLCDSVRCV